MPDKKDNEFIRDEYKSTLKINKDYQTTPFEKYSGKFRTSFSTLVLGILLSVTGLIVLGYSDGLDNELNVIRRSPLIQEESLLRSSGVIKLTGKPIVRKELTLPEIEEDLIYYEKIEEEKIDGEWVEVRKNHVFAPFSIGSIYVDSASADIEFDVIEISKNETENERETIYGVLAKDEVIVIGDLKDNAIVGGGVFVITNKSNKDLAASMSTVSNLEWWLYKIGVLFLLTLGMTAFILPVLSFVDIIPNIGLGTIGLLLLFALMISALIVFVSAIMITFWWLIFVIAGFVIILLIRIKSRRKHSPISFIP